MPLLLLLGACANSPIDSSDSSAGGSAETSSGATDLDDNDSPGEESAAATNPDEQPEQAGEQEPSDDERSDSTTAATTPPQQPAIESLEALFPREEEVPPQLTTQLSYASLEELELQRQDNPPIKRCDQALTPTSIATDGNGESAGQRYEYDDGTKTATVQIWLFESPVDAATAMDSVAELRCEGVDVGTVQLNGISFAQQDFAIAAPLPASATPGADRAEAAHFERNLTSSDDALIVFEELFFEQFGPVVVFSGLREIGSGDGERLSADTATMVLHRRTAERVLAALGRSLPDPPASTLRSAATALVGIDIAPGIYRSTTIDAFCVVRRLTHVDTELASQIAVVTWGAGEQGVLQILASDGAIETQDQCGTWELIDLESSPASAVDNAAPGTLILNVDISPGTVVVTSLGDCTVRQLSGFSGSPSDVLDEVLVTRGERYEFLLSDEAGVYLSVGCQR